MKEWLISKLEVRLQDDAKVFCIDSRWWNDNDFKIVFSFVIQNQLERDCNTQKIWPNQQPPKSRKIKEEVRGFCTGAKFFSEMSAMVGTVADEFWSLSNERNRKRYL